MASTILGATSARAADGPLFNLEYHDAQNQIAQPGDNAVTLPVVITDGYLTVVDFDRDDGGWLTLLPQDIDGQIQWAARLTADVDYSLDQDWRLYLRDFDSNSMTRTVMKLNINSAALGDIDILHANKWDATSRGDAILLNPEGSMGVVEADGSGVRFIRFQPDGSVEWVNHYSTAPNPVTPRLTTLPDGGFLLSWGHAESMFGFEMRTSTTVAKLDANGSVEWTTRLEVPGGILSGNTTSVPQHFHRAPDGGYLGTGAGVFGAPSVVKLDSGGDVDWAREYPDVQLGLLAPGATEPAYRLWGVVLYPDEQDPSDLVVFNISPATGEITEQIAFDAGGAEAFHSFGPADGAVLFGGTVERDDDNFVTFVGRMNEDLSSPVFFDTEGLNPSPILGQPGLPVPFARWDDSRDSLFVMTTDTHFENDQCAPFTGFSVSVEDPGLSSASILADLEISHPAPARSSQSLANLTSPTTQNWVENSTVVWSVFEVAPGCFNGDGGGPQGVVIDVSTASGADEVALSWEAEASETYVIESTSSLTEEWGVEERITPDDDGEISRSFAPEEDAEFFRIQVEA